MHKNNDAHAIVTDSRWGNALKNMNVYILIAITIPDICTLQFCLNINNYNIEEFLKLLEKNVNDLNCTNKSTEIYFKFVNRI